MKLTGVDGFAGERCEPERREERTALEGLSASDVLAAVKEAFHEQVLEPTVASACKFE